MKTLNTRWRLIALVPSVAIAILLIGNRIKAVPNQNREVREAAHEVGIVVEGGITRYSQIGRSEDSLAVAFLATPQAQRRGMAASK